MTTTKCTKVSEAHGAYCATCDHVFDVSTVPYWHWSKSAAMHRDGTGHKVEMYRFERS